MKKTKMTTKDFVRIGMLTALACVLTMVPQIPTGTGGYVHFGDSIIYVTAAFMGPIAGAFVGAIGHSLADLLSGYVIFAIATFIIKGIMGFVIGKILYENFSLIRFIIAAAAALLIVTLGYFIAEIPMFGLETAAVVFISSPIQWLMSVAASAIFIPLLNKYKSKIF
ncbi:MAG: ECF transporter S component [Clostridiales bacterium]|nr:ECF transporter S component [Clostridiales bacterium]